MLYLSHNLSGFDKLEPLYLFIWQWINRPAANSKELSAALDTNAIKEAVLDEIYIRIHKTEIDDLHAQLKQQDKLTIWARLIDTGIIDERGNILKEHITEKDIDGIVASELECTSSIRYRLRYILNECIDRVRLVEVPKYLKPFVEQHLESWIRSAVTAFFMKSGEDYVVDLDNTDTSQDRNPNIIIIDRDTGTDMANSQWDEALYQFLQLKHGCKLSLQNLKAVFISNVSYFKKYKTLNGLTGTLGTKRDRDLLQQIHDVDYVIIPTAESKQFHEEKSLVCTTKEHWKSQILEEANQITNDQKRSVLIICETVNVVNDLYQLFGRRKERHVHTYTRDYEQFEVAKDGHELNPGQIIIATNLAGRGTDIKISEDLNKAGGLHVVLTYLPNNIRIEQQAFGRAARCGAKGSGRLIILNTKEQKSGCTKILELKRNRHTQELRRLAECKLFYDVQITAEEECFEKFNVEYGRLKKELKNKQLPNELQTILLDSCLDKWALWLDEHSKWISTNKTTIGNAKFQSALNTLMQQIKNLSAGATKQSLWDKIKTINPLKEYVYDSKCWSEWVKDNPSQMIELGKYLSLNLKQSENVVSKAIEVGVDILTSPFAMFRETDNYFDTAMELFDDVIQLDANFAEVAHYYKASALIKHSIKNWAGDVSSEIKTELKLAASLFETRIEQHSKAASIIGNIKMQSTEALFQINAFEDQQHRLMELYYEFITSINNILGYPVSADCFLSPTPSIDKQLANEIFAELLHHKVLDTPNLGNEYSENDLKVICTEYGVPVSLLQNTMNMWEGKRINEKDFRKHLEQHIPIPNRRQFWTMLLEKNVLCDNKQYVAIKKERFQGIDCDFIKSLRENVNKEHKEHILNLGDGSQVLFTDWTELEKDNELIFENEHFKALVGDKKYDEWNELEALSFNEKANINCSYIENVRLDAFDSIRPDDFANVGIVLSEAEDILTQLVKENVLVKESVATENIYRLNIRLNEISEEQLTFYAGYKQIVLQLLEHCFAYRSVVDKMIKCLHEGISQISLCLVVDPHRDFLMELYEKNVLIPTCVDSNEKCLDKKVEYICMNSSNKRLQDPLVIKRLIDILTNLRSIFNHMECPDGNHKRLCDSSKHTEEQQLFVLKGLDYLINYGEYKSPYKMLKALLSSCIAAGQIAFRMASSLITSRSPFIKEQLNNFIVDLRAFDWRDFLNQKWKIRLLTACAAGISYAVKHFSKLLRYGIKTCVVSAFQSVSKVLQNQFTNITEQNKIASISKRLVTGSVGKIAIAIGNSNIDNIIQTCLHTICTEFQASIASDIDEVVGNHSIISTLQQVFDILGETHAKQMVLEQTESYFNDKSNDYTLLIVIDELRMLLSDKLVEALSKSVDHSYKGNNLDKIKDTISSLLTCNNRVYHLNKIKLNTNRMLDDLDKTITQMLKNQTNVRNEPQEDQKNTDYVSFKDDIMNQWKEYVKKKTDKVVVTSLETPLLQSASTYLSESAFKLLKNTKNCRPHKERKYRKRYDQLKRDCKGQKNNVRTVASRCNRHNATSKIEKKYDNILLTLLIKTHSADLVFDLIRENRPMDWTCIAAFPALLSRITKEENIKIVVEKPDGETQIFASNIQSSTVTRIIRLKITEEHFTICNESMKQNDSNENSLYSAMIQAMPEVNMTPKDFKKAIQTLIRMDPAIRCSIENGYHDKLYARAFYSGTQYRSNRSAFNIFGSIEPSGQNEEQSYDEIRYQQRVRNEKVDFYSNFSPMFFDEELIDNANLKCAALKHVVKDGKSTGRDQSKGRWLNSIRTLLTRFGRTNPALARTEQGVLSSINENAKHSLIKETKDIEALQSQWVANAPSITIDSDVTYPVKRKLYRFRKKIVCILEQEIKSDPTNKQIYESAISQITACDMTKFIGIPKKNTKA
uniref:Putative preprotein translocase subunit seca n=1 Tax=Anopheles marajoara TaxID=58244 RepID=A0A2M4B8K5_9DIPT